MNLLKRLLAALCVMIFAAGTSFAGGKGESGAAAPVERKWPSKNLTIVVPYVAGGAADIIVRKIASMAEPKIGKPVVVVNRTGGAGVLAATEYLKEEADTHSLILLSRALMVTIPAVQANPLEFTLDDFVPVIGIENNDFILFANAKAGIKDMESLAAYAKTKSSLKYGSVGVGTDGSVLQACLWGVMGIKAEAVQYGGGAKEAVLAVSNNVIDVSAATPTAAMEMVNEGSVVPIAIFSSKDYTGFPGKTVPAITKLGYDLDLPGKNFLAIRKGTSQENIDYLYGIFKEIYDSAEYQEFSKTVLFNIDDSNSAALSSYLAGQTAIINNLKQYIK
jgi:tripartite-type tricarboxylate transporter receptor subunit TctC